jgi:hypothetical protein
VVNEELLALFCLELLTVNFYNYVHFTFCLNGFLRQVDRISAVACSTHTD